MVLRATCAGSSTMREAIRAAAGVSEGSSPRTMAVSASAESLGAVASHDRSVGDSWTIWYTPQSMHRQTPFWDPPVKIPASWTSAPPIGRPTRLLSHIRVTMDACVPRRHSWNRSRRRR
ncbi:hypothetical protein SCOCK_360063 [Actinacidiphila cocklensis]|uniref:Uncharacterized protein n=1 Tax=Actinacidiphila cocklensis TaxID=887465 RepID=A0A9W4DXS2_9ACTN|nr:hypothetical protein SCOCK_360063 [Actinacidiphila cocklensis]